MTGNPTGGLVEDWTSCVKSLTVSSRESWAYRLTDASASYWQSCGPQVIKGVILFRVFSIKLCVTFSQILSLTVHNYDHFILDIHLVIIKKSLT